MPEENFEQQARRKAEEFSMEPKPEVWQHVETAIAPKERRRRVLVWWWLLPLCVAGVIAVWPNHNHTSAIAEKAFVPNTSNNLSTEKEINSPSQQEENISEANASSIGKKDRKQEEVNENLVFGKRIDAETSINKSHETGNDFSTAGSSKKKTENEAESNVSINTTSEDTSGNDEIVKTVPDGEQPYAGLQSKIDLEIPSASDNNITLQGERKADSVPAAINDSSQKKSISLSGNDKKEKPNKKRSWQIGISAEIGLTSWGKALLYNEVGSTGAYTITDGSIWSVSTRDSIENNTTAVQKTKNGLTLAAGFVVRKEIQRHFYIRGQLGYRYQQFKVYNLRLSLAPQPLGGGAYFVNTDTYRTHFFNLTLSVGKRVLSNQRIALSAEAGIDNSFLFTLNRQKAAQSQAFDEAKSLGVSSFNRWQPHLVVSLPFDWHLANKVKFVLSPFARFGLRTFQKSGGDYRDNHLVSAGVQAIYFFR